MNTQITVTGAAQQLMAKTFALQKVSLPFGRDIFLLETHVAGLRYHQAEIAVPKLAVGQSLALRREPANPHDELAIEIIAATGLKLGYIPRHRNPVLARLMDAGKQLLAAVASIGADSRYSAAELPDIRLRISMRE
ncbi:MAG: HIRAN domain-containing protein [Sulfurisoma sp.]|nr:HIRAN domain-containing protein [Sulfurisoma sp.]